MKLSPEGLAMLPIAIRTQSKRAALDAANAPSSSAVLRVVDSFDLAHAMRPKPQRLPSGLLWWMPLLCGVFIGAFARDIFDQQVVKAVQARVSGVAQVSR